MLTHTKTNIEEDEIIIIDASNKSQYISDKLTSTILEERVKAAAKLEGVSTDKILARNKKTMITSNNNNVSNNVSRNNADRLSKESGIGSSVGSSFDERDDDMDHIYNEQFTSSSSQSTINTSVSTENPKLSPVLNQSLDDLDDTSTKSPNDNKNPLGIITEEEELYNNNLNNNNISHLNHHQDNHNNNSLFKKYHQNRLTVSDSNSEVTESSTFNDTESSTSGGDPDSPALLNNNLPLQINNSTRVDLDKKKSSYKRKNSGRSIFSVLSSSSLRSSSSSSLQRGSLSDPEDSFPNHHHHQRAATPGSPSKSDRILGRSGFSSLSIRRRPGKILGLTISEDKILLDNKVTKKSRDVKTTSSSSDEKLFSSTKSFNKNNLNKANKLLGINDNKPLLNKQSKASKILGLDDIDLNRRSPSMYIDRGSIESQITVASIRKNVICKGFLTKHTNTHFKSWKSWKRRYFILAKNTLYCFKSSDNSSPLLEQFELTSESVVCVSDTFSGKSWVLQVGKSNHSNQKSWYIQADNVDDMKVWLTELKSTVIHQRTFSSPSKLTNSPESSLIKSSSSIDDYSLPPPPRPFMMTSLPPPPRPRSAPSSPSCPPSPITSLSPPPRQISPLNHIPSDVEELCSINNDDDLEIPRSSSPVETLSPPRARLGNLTHQHNSSISSTYSTASVTSSPLRNKQRSNSANSALSINTTLTSIKKQSSPRQSPLSSPSVNNSPRKSTRSSTTSSHRESIPIMMPSWGLMKTTSPTSLFDNSNNFLSPPPRSLSHLPLRNVQQLPYKSSDFYARLPSPPKLPEGPKPPARDNVKVPLINPDLYLTRNPPPNIPLPQPPPRPANTLTSASRVASRNHPPISLHPPPPIPPPRRPSADGRMGGIGTKPSITNLPVPIQNMKQATSPPRERASIYDRTMTLPNNLPSHPSSNTRLSVRSKSPPLSVYSSNSSRFQTMPINIAPLPPPTRPPNIPLPPVPTQSLSVTKINKEIRSQIVKNASNLSNSDTSQQLFASGLTFVMVEETLGDGELVLDLQDVSEDHPHIIRSKSSQNNIRNELIRNDKEEKNTNKKNIPILEQEGNEKENLKEKEKETVEELEDKSVKENLEKNDTINDVNGHVNNNVISKNNINNIPSSNMSI
ncbi:15784_t:CDS:2 [Rhizophagus irregularis]|nr:15784_t:CDS:2 [Rhizophagus irregularis]